MIEYFADLGISMAKWPTHTQKAMFYGYCAVFGISGLLGEWLRRRSVARRSVPRNVVRLWIPIYMIAVFMLTLTFYAISTATRSAIASGDASDSLTHESRDFIDRLHHASSVGFLVVAYIGVALWLWVRRCRSTSSS